jgi:hypothetical protein
VAGPAARRLGQMQSGKDIMKNTSVSKCANPQCEREFKRLDEGKLYVRPDRKSNGLTQKALWLCPVCSRQFDLHYDRHKYEYCMIRRRPMA